ncbi:hypothetical protein GCM10027160_23250 [Streptomyces calidiresistens]
MGCDGGEPGSGVGAREALERAVEADRRVAGRHQEVRRLAEELRRLRQENHFAENFRKALREGRQAP